MLIRSQLNVVLRKSGSLPETLAVLFIAAVMHLAAGRRARRLLDGVPEETEAGQNGGSAGGKDVKEFTVRAVVAGLVIGALLCGSNMHFGLQTGLTSCCRLPELPRVKA